MGKVKKPVVVIDGAYGNPNATQDTSIGRVIKWEDPTATKPATPDTRRRRVELSEARQELRIDETWYPLSGEKQVYFLGVLIKRKSEWIGGKDLVDPQKRPSWMKTEPRADKILKSLPGPVRNIIETRPGPSGGYRIKPEYFE